MSKLEKLRRFENSDVFCDLPPAELESVEGGGLIIIVAFTAGVALGFVAGYQAGAAQSTKPVS